MLSQGALAADRQHDRVQGPRDCTIKSWPVRTRCRGRGHWFAEGLCGYTMRLELLEFLGTTLPDKIECSHKSSREVAPINQTRRIPTVHVEQLRTCFNLPHLRAARSPRTAIVPDAAR